eukprot:TRINITY_DN8722_c0_g1_i3.p1 TRINITY_DN8722_c0_g1~~TRINITY_DN8722_c0_g1_i3.p1  ORF type:complete len:607 (+),score=71.19 TRINITY_DN8722_c0_g1_i3:87-1823(+)
MEVTSENFDLACIDIERRLPTTAYIAIDLELTGVSVFGNSEQFCDVSTERLKMACDAAEKFAVVQFGLTLCQVKPFQPDEMTTYNIILAPESSFLCEASALDFIRKHGGDLNTWVDKGVRWGFRRKEFVDLNALRGREPGAAYIIRASVLRHAREMGIDLNRWVDEHDVSKWDPTVFWHRKPDVENNANRFTHWNCSFVRLWYLLRSAARPLVVHGLLDVFFILSNMERQRLPRNPQAFARLVKECFPGGIYDTSYLHEAIEELRLLPMNLQTYHQRVVQSCSMVFPSGYSFSTSSAGSVHQAGFDSRLTAELFRCLCLLYEDRVYASKDRLYLHNCGACLDLGRALQGECPDGPCFGDDPNLTLLVAVMHSDDARRHTPSRISELAKQDKSFFYRKTNDARFLLVVLRCRGSLAEQKAADLGAALPDVTWAGFHTWKRQLRAYWSTYAGAVGRTVRFEAVLPHSTSSSSSSVSVRAGPQPSAPHLDGEKTVRLGRTGKSNTKGHASTSASSDSWPPGSRSDLDRVAKDNVRRSGRNAEAHTETRASSKRLSAPLPVGKVTKPALKDIDSIERVRPCR